METTIKMTIPEIFLRARVRELDRIMAIPVAPPVAPNARVIAKWPAKQVSTLTGIGRLHKGPAQSYRIW